MYRGECSACTWVGIADQDEVSRAAAVHVRRPDHAVVSWPIGMVERPDPPTTPDRCECGRRLHPGQYTCDDLGCQEHTTTFSRTLARQVTR